MGSLFISLLPLIIGSAVVPLHIIMIILVLTSDRQPIAKALAFVGGMTLVRIGQGIFFGLIFRGSADASASSEGSGWVVSTLLLVLGLLLLIAAFKTWRNEPDADDPPPRWLTMMDGISPLGAFGIGAGLILIGAKLWVFTLGAIGTIGDGQIGQPAGAFMFLLYVLLAESLLLAPIAVRALFPEQADAWLNGMSAWLEKYNRPIVMTVSFIFGCFFLYKGISGFFA
jgi:hypothetical protein